MKSYLYSTAKLLKSANSGAVVDAKSSELFQLIKTFKSFYGNVEMTMQYFKGTHNTKEEALAHLQIHSYLFR